MLSVPISSSPSIAPPGFGGGTISAVTHARICVLSIEHDDLDRAITTLVAANNDDDLAIGRLKKRKLRIRDEIARLLATPTTEADHG